MAVPPPVCRINDILIGVIREAFMGDLATNLIVLIDGVIDHRRVVLLGLPWGDNQGDL